VVWVLPVLLILLVAGLVLSPVKRLGGMYRLILYKVVPWVLLSILALGALHVLWVFVQDPHRTAKEMLEKLRTTHYATAFLFFAGWVTAQWVRDRQKQKDQE